MPQPSVTPEPAYSLYVHVPFCAVKCSYCAFNTYTNAEHLIPPYVQAVIAEMAQVGRSAPEGLRAHTLYFGGGTPSLLTAAQVEALIDAAAAYLGLRSDAEISLEVEPGSASLETLRAYRVAGVGRASLGVQSAHASELAMFRRGHTFQEACATFGLLRQAGFDNISLDLIYGAPGQTVAAWTATLEAALGWQPDHLSLYSLILEPHTELTHLVKKGHLPTPDDDLAADMYDLARDRLAQAGLQQYEIASWARTGRECQHNQQYWRRLPYLGLGAGAHGHAAETRYSLIRPIPAYIEAVSSGQPPAWPLSSAVEHHQQIEAPEAMAEALMLGLRLVRDGFDVAVFEAWAGQPIEAVFGQHLSSLQAHGLIEARGGRLYLTEQAYLISNQVFYRLLPD